jgi:hypothetical protein
MPDAEKAWAFLKESDPVASAAQVRSAVSRVAAGIHDS